MNAPLFDDDDAPDLDPDQLFEQMIADLETLAGRLPFITAPGLDCYVRGCKTPPYISTRSKRHGLVTTCPDHDPHSWGDGDAFDQYVELEAEIAARRSQETPGDAPGDDQGASQDRPQSQADIALEALQLLIRIAAQRGDDTHDGSGGTREPRRPVPPTLPAGGRHADDFF